MKYERLTAQGDDVSFYDRTIEECERDYYRLKEYEDKIENGTLVELPCKVGDTVYAIWDYESVVELNVILISFARYGTRIDTDCGNYFIEEIGITIFLTKAEAEKQLEELKKQLEELRGAK